MDLGVRASSPLDRYEGDSSLSRFASFGITGFPVQPLCHVAVWIWAAQQCIYGSSAQSPTMMWLAEKIASLPRGPQNALLQVRPSGRWDFDITGDRLPPVGSVLIWTQRPTHSAIVTPHGITGYNQRCILPEGVTGAGYTHGQPGQLASGMRRCLVIREEDMLRAARAMLRS